MNGPDSAKNKTGNSQFLLYLMNEIMSSEYFTRTIHTIIQTGGFVDKHLQQALNALRVASKRDLEDIEERLVRLEQKMERTIEAVEELRELSEYKGSKNRRKQGVAASSRQPVICARCGQKFVPKSIHQRFCSAACRSQSSEP